MLMRYIWKLSIVFCVVANPCFFTHAIADGEDQNGFGGVGLQITVQEGNAHVVSVIPGSPAEKAGLQAGDLITQINGQPVSEMQSSDVVNKIRGPEGTGINFNVKRVRDGEEKDFDVTVNREFIVANSTSTTGASKLSTPPDFLNGVPTANSVLYFAPLSSRVSPTKPFQLSIVLDNPKGVNADDLGLWIQYNPKAVTLSGATEGVPFELESAPFSGWTQVTSFSHISTGELFIRLKAQNERKILSGKLGTLEFQATGKIPVSQIYFRFNNTWGDIPNTFMTYKGKDVLGKELDHADGAISGTVRVLRADQLSD